MFGFGKSTTAAETSETPQPPSREQRQLCWNKRDEYFACLDKHGIIQPAEGELGDKEGKCTAQRTSYEGSCGRSWVSASRGREGVAESALASFAADLLLPEDYS